MNDMVVSDKRRVIGEKRKLEERAFTDLSGRRTGVRMNPTTLDLWNVKKYIIQELCKGLERRVEGDHCA